MLHHNPTDTFMIS